MGHPPKEIRNSIGWVRGDARACALVDWGIEVRNAFDVGAQFEIAGVEEDAAQDSEQIFEAKDVAVSGRRNRVAAILAEAIL
jgi:hypothetical protein